MLWAIHQQMLDPLKDTGVPFSAFLSTVAAALPVVALFYLLVPKRWPAPWAGAGATAVALVLAVVVYRMPPHQAALSVLHGAAFGLLPVGWTIFWAMMLYNITVETGQFDVVRRSVASLSADARIQAILIAFAFGAFLEGAAGGGTPVAICGAIMVGLGFDPFLAAVLCLIANTSPVAFGGLGTPLITLTAATGLDTGKLSVMAGHQLPLLSLIVPLYMVRCMCNWRQTFEVWPALLVAGGSFAGFQYFFATSHTFFPSLVLWPMTDIGGGIFSLVLTAVFLQFWKPATLMRFAPPAAAAPAPAGHAPEGHEAEAEMAKALLGPKPASDEKPLTPRRVAVAWMPFVLMSVFLMLTGIVRQREPGSLGGTHVTVGGVQTNYILPVPWVHDQVARDPYLRPTKNETAVFNFAWLTAPGTAVMFAALLSMAVLGMNPTQIGAVFRRTFAQMSVPIPTICFMLGLSYVTKYAGMDATLGLAFSYTGVLYPFFAPMLGWLGVFLTGTDAGSNALFGSLQKITADQLHGQGVFPLLTQDQAQVLICTSNSTGGVMGKMIDAQSIVVATAATDQIGKEADIFKAVLWHSVILASVVGVITVLQAYAAPFTWLVPK
ncbi:MAG: L-lactate permease [Gemmataceae bacterium]